MESFDVTGALDTEAGDIGTGAEAGDFFVEGHQADDAGNALFEGQVGF